MTHMSMRGNIQGLLRPKLIMVHCHFHFILLPRASHMAKSQVKWWGNIFCSFSGKNGKVHGKDMDTGRGRELEPMRQSTTMIGGPINLNQTLLLEDSGVSVSMWGLGIDLFQHLKTVFQVSTVIFLKNSLSIPKFRRAPKLLF